jgi:ABC-type transport system involved in cytochrome c biogenesis permease component
VKISPHFGEYIASIALMVCLLLGALALSCLPTIVNALHAPHRAVTADAS